MNKKLLGLYGLKWNPFSPDLPQEALLVTPKMESFCWRLEQTVIREGGFMLITGDHGLSKSVTLRVIRHRLEQLSDVAVAALTQPRCKVGDFYRQLGDLFGVDLRPSNRWGGFKALRERWNAHIESTLVRPVLLIDEAQDMPTDILSELRLLSSTQFDSRIVLAVILAGDGRLLDKLRTDDLLPLGSRIRTRLVHEPQGRDELMALLKHLVTTAGAAKLMTPELMTTVCDHSAGNPRVMTQIANEILATGLQRDGAPLDEKLYLEVFDATRAVRPAGPKGRTRVSEDKTGR